MRAGLVLSGGGVSAVAVQRGHLLQHDRPWRRCRLHRYGSAYGAGLYRLVGSPRCGWLYRILTSLSRSLSPRYGRGPLRAGGQHRADQVQRRHRPARRWQAHVRQVRGRHVPARRRQAGVRRLRARSLLPAWSKRGAAMRGRLVLEPYRPQQRRTVQHVPTGLLRGYGQHCTEALPPRHDRR